MVSIVEMVGIGLAATVLGVVVVKGVSNYRQKNSTDTTEYNSMTDPNNISYGGRSRKNRQRKNKSRRR